MIVSLSQIKKSVGEGSTRFHRNTGLHQVTSIVGNFHECPHFSQNSRVLRFFIHYQITLHYFTIQFDEFAILKTDACHNLIDQRYACFLLLYIIKAVKINALKIKHLGTTSGLC